MGGWACIVKLSAELAEAGMSALSVLLPSWSTVLLVLLIAILSLIYWVVKGVSVETLLASYRLVNQGRAICIELGNEELLAGGPVPRHKFKQQPSTDFTSVPDCHPYL